MHSSRLDRAPASAQLTAVDARLVVLLADLHRLHLHGHVHTYDIAGEDDVRLEASAEGCPVTVELLWCLPGEKAPSRLAAVRVDGVRRQVWRGRDRRWAPEQAVRFVYDLLICDDEVLEARYERLG